MASSAEKKLKALTKCKKKLEPNSNHTNTVRSKASSIEDALLSYVKSDNIGKTADCCAALYISIESHADFQSAISNIDRAIRRAEEEVEEEKKKEEEGIKFFGFIPM